MKLAKIIGCVWLALVALLPTQAGAQTEPTAAIYSSLTGQLTMPLVQRDGLYYANAVYSLPSGQVMQMTTPGTLTSSWETRLPVHDTQAGTIFLPRVSLGSETYYNVLVSVPAAAAWSVRSLWQGVNSGSGFPIVSTISNRWAVDAAGILSYVLNNGQVWRIAQGGEEPCFPAAASLTASDINASSNVSIYPNTSSPSTNGVSNTDYLMMIVYTRPIAVDGNADGDTVDLNEGAATYVESCTVYPIFLNGTTIAPTTAMASAPAAVTGNVGSSAAVLISGGVPPYTIVVDNMSVAQIAAQAPATGTIGQQVSMQLASVGTATMTVVDYAQTRLTVPITVAASTLVASETSLSGTAGDTPTLYVYGGIPPYSVTSSNTKIATVSAVQSGNGMSITVKMLSAGTATILVTDPDTSGTVVIPVTVAASTVSDLPPFYTIPTTSWTDAGALDTPAIESTAGTTWTLYLVGGTPPYTVANTNPTSAALTYVGQSVEGWATYRVDFLRAPGDYTFPVMFTDATGRTTVAMLKVTANTSLSVLTVSPLEVTAHAFNKQFTLYVSGGYPPYEAFSGMDTIEVSKLTDKSFRVKVNAPYLDYITNITVVDSAGDTNSINVNVLSQPPGYDQYK